MMIKIVQSMYMNSKYKVTDAHELKI